VAPRGGYPLSVGLHGQVAQPDGSGYHDAGVHPAQPQLTAGAGVDEPHGLRPEALDELGATQVGVLADLQHRLTQREQAASREVVHAQIQIDIELITSQRHPLGSPGDELGHPRVHHRHLLARVGRTIRHAGAPTGEPVVSGQSRDLVENRLLRQLSPADLRAADDQHQQAVVVWGPADMVEPRLQTLA